MNYKYVTEEEVQQMSHDWRYRGWTTISLLTEEECDEINKELEQLRLERNLTTKDDGSEWGEWDPYMYPHKISQKLEKLFAHPKVLEAC